MLPTQNASNRSSIETVLVLLLLLALMFAVFDVLKPFFGILTFSLIFAVSFSNPFEKLVKLLAGRRKLAAIIYVVILLSIVTMPFIYIVSAISAHLKDAMEFITDVKQNGLPPLPAAILHLPVVGPSIDAFWNNILLNPQQTIGPYEKQIKGTLQQMVATGTGMLGATVQFILGIIISAFLLVTGHKMLIPIKAAMKHLLGAKDGIELLNASEQAVKGVSIGVMGTALITAIVCWIGFSIAAVPFALGLAALVFFLVLIQIGPLLVWIPLIIWYATLGETGWTIFLIAYAVGVMVMETILKPYLISKSGGALPFLILFIGVTGGMLAWGFTGMFKGAIVMALFYTIFTKWLENRRIEQDHITEDNNREDGAV